MAAKWHKDRHDNEEEASSSSSLPSSDTSSSTGVSRPKGFDNVAWRALEQMYAREVLPHPYLHRDYLEITEVKREKKTGNAGARAILRFF